TDETRQSTVERSAGPSESAGRVVRQPRLGHVRLPGGRVEPLDADLVIGRQPAHAPLEARQRAVVAGEHDRTVSRRHIELRTNGWDVTALVSGHNTRLERQSVISALPPGSEVQLLLDDTLLFGVDTWLRYVFSGHSGDSAALDASARGRAGSTGQAEALQHGGAAAGSDGKSDAEPSPGTRPCGGCEHPNALSATVCRRCERALDVTAGTVARAGLPSLGTIRFSDGTAETLDADLVIGRGRGGGHLEAQQRAVEYGSDDRTISRRHIELSVNGWEVTARCLGNRILLECSTDAGSRILSAGETAPLRPGDILHFGASSWLRYDTGVPSG
ncbi:MAG: hypothetical protein OXC00_00665, partial [Acidimicrobiaceae bacterium]|nr:hypothetical protein [Acidimicrobiaceae bacterium]